MGQPYMASLPGGLVFQVATYVHVLDLENVMWDSILGGILTGHGLVI